jgi:TPR repeat protein
VVQDAEWCKKAAKQRVAKAQNNLGQVYHEGEGVVQDASSAERWGRKAAEQGDAHALWGLGQLYMMGESVI